MHHPYRHVCSRSLGICPAAPRMAPLRREGSPGAGSAACHQSPYCRGGGRGWLSRRRRRRRRCRTSGGGFRVCDDTGGASLTDDVLAAIFTRLPNAADVVRCAATCRRWASVVAKEADALSRALLLPPLPGLALGFFHIHHQDRQDAGAVTTNTRKRKRRSTVECSTPPCFVPTASGSRLLGFGFNLLSTTGLQAGGQQHGVFDLSRSRPIASRNGRLVLELQSVDGSLRLCVCNPMIGDVAVLPPLLGKDRPKIYACTLLTGADLDRPRRPSPSSDDFFRVLIIYNRDRFTALRSYSSDTCSWSMEAKKTSGPKLTNWDLGKLGQGIVLHGVAYWPLKRTALAVRFDTPAPPAQVRSTSFSVDRPDVRGRRPGETPELDHRVHQRPDLERPAGLGVLQRRGLVRAHRFRAGEAPFDRQPERDAQLPAMVSASRIIAAASTRVSAQRQIASSVARVSALSGRPSPAFPAGPACKETRPSGSFRTIRAPPAPAPAGPARSPAPPG